MPLNFYSFLIADMLAEREFEAKNVPNKARSQQLGLVASLFSPSGSAGGLGSSVIPAVLVQQTARREAEQAASDATARLSTSTGATTGQTPGGTSAGGGGGGAATGSTVTRDEFQTLNTKVGTLEGLFVDYPNVKGQTFKVAKDSLKDFYLLTLDDLLGKPINDEIQIVVTQIPEAKPGMKLLRGSIVAIGEDVPRFEGNG